MSSSRQIRNQMRTCRQALSPSIQRAHSQALARHFIGSKLFMRSNRIALFLANDGELDPGLLTQKLINAGKSLYLPALKPNPWHALWFIRYHQNSHLIRNRFGINEPDIQFHPATPPWGLDLILLPLVAFDNKGNRLGMGGGFYDRTLSSFNTRHRMNRPQLIGLAHECQRVDQLKAQTWDIPLDGIITEQGITYWQR